MFRRIRSAQSRRRESAARARGILAVSEGAVSEPVLSAQKDSEVEQLLSQAESLFAQFHIDEAVVLDRKALQLSPPDHPKRWASLTQLQHHLWKRYNQLGMVADMEEAIVLARAALDSCSPGRLDRSTSLSHVANLLSDRYKLFGDMIDLDEAIVLRREALQLCPPGHSNQPMYMNSMADHFFLRYKQLGSISDLYEAINFGEKALSLCPSGHPNRPMYMNTMAIYLFLRYKQLGSIADLDQIIAVEEEVLRLCSSDHPYRPMYMNNMADHFFLRYKHLGDIEDLYKAIDFGKEALSLCPSGHPNRPMYLNSMADYLSLRYKQLGRMEDIDEAIFLGREALDLSAPGHPNRTVYMDNVASYLSLRYEQLEGIADLDEAIAMGQEALQLHPFGHPDRSHSLTNLARYLRTRFRHLTQFADLEHLFSLCTELTRVPQMISSADLSAAKEWVNAAEEFHHPTSLLAYETSLRLLAQHLATSPSLPQHLSIPKRLTLTLATDAFSACLRNSHPEKAVELLEQGRDVFWSQITRLRSPLDDVVASGPAGRALAHEFTRLTSHLRGVINSHGSDQPDQLALLNPKIQEVVTNIRELPGLERFLLPPLFSHLQRAASCGPVIIMNASQYGCDALVVFADRDPVHIPLNITKARVRGLSEEASRLIQRAKMTDIKRGLASFLRELWDEVISSIVNYLWKIVPAQSRIWWCPTAEFSLLPLHAAGPHRKGQKNLSDLYISSYTYTLTALIRARQDHTSGSMTKEKHFVTIGQALAAGQNQLSSVGGELATIRQRIEGLASFTSIEGSESSISRVSEELVKNEWVHFACHGLPNWKDPLDSAFALHDGSLTIQRIVQCRLENSEFAYLTVGHTAIGDEENLDEGIHLASLMQFAGFRSVIGTMWAVDDAGKDKVTSAFYKEMVDESGRLDYTRAAFALNQTMNTIDAPLDQRILYVHTGA